MSGLDESVQPPAASVPGQPFPLPDGLRTVALLADVHGNAPALAACLTDVLAAAPDAIVFLGCLTWGPEPRRVLELARSAPVPTFFLRGNGERAVLELADGTRPQSAEIDPWMVRAHGPDALRFLASVPRACSVRLAGYGPVRLCHGSPRSDIELLTPGTPAERIAQACATVAEPTVVHGHTHLQYSRQVGQRRIIGSGSVGLPYGGDGPGARWTLLAPDIQARTTRYDVRQAIDAAEAVGYPNLERYTRTLLSPPSLAEIVADAEQREFAD